MERPDPASLENTRFLIIILFCIPQTPKDTQVYAGSYFILTHGCSIREDSFLARYVSRDVLKAPGINFHQKTR